MNRECWFEWFINRDHHGFKENPWTNTARLTAGLLYWGSFVRKVKLCHYQPQQLFNWIKCSGLRQVKPVIFWLNIIIQKVGLWTHWGTLLHSLICALRDFFSLILCRVMWTQLKSVITCLYHSLTKIHLDLIRYQFSNKGISTFN